MVLVKPIRYYQLFNNGIGIVIWAQLVHPEGVGKVLWDGRYEKGGSATLIGQSSIVDLAVTGIEPGVPFYLSSHTLWGIDQTERAQQFIYEPESNLMASAVRAGPARAGQLSWTGTVAW